MNATTHWFHGVTEEYGGTQRHFAAVLVEGATHVMVSYTRADRGKMPEFDRFDPIELGSHSGAVRKYNELLGAKIGNGAEYKNFRGPYRDFYGLRDLEAASIAYRNASNQRAQAQRQMQAGTKTDSPRAQVAESMEWTNDPRDYLGARPSLTQRDLIDSTSATGDARSVKLLLAETNFAALQLDLDDDARSVAANVDPRFAGLDLDDDVVSPLTTAPAAVRKIGSPSPARRSSKPARPEMPSLDRRFPTAAKSAADLLDEEIQAIVNQGREVPRNLLERRRALRGR